MLGLHYSNTPIEIPADNLLIIFTYNFETVLKARMVSRFWRDECNYLYSKRSTLSKVRWVGLAHDNIEEANMQLSAYSHPRLVQLLKLELIYFKSPIASDINPFLSRVQGLFQNIEYLSIKGPMVGTYFNRFFTNKQEEVRLFDFFLKQIHNYWPNLKSLSIDSDDYRYSNSIQIDNIISLFKNLEFLKIDELNVKFSSLQLTSNSLKNIIITNCETKTTGMKSDPLTEIKTNFPNIQSMKIVDTRFYPKFLSENLRELTLLNNNISNEQLSQCLSNCKSLHSLSLRSSSINFISIPQSSPIVNLALKMNGLGDISGSNINLIQLDSLDKSHVKRTHPQHLRVQIKCEEMKFLLIHSPAVRVKKMKHPFSLYLYRSQESKKLTKKSNISSEISEFYCFMLKRTHKISPLQTESYQLLSHYLQEDQQTTVLSQLTSRIYMGC